MEVILTKDVPNLGSLGDTVQVKSGYGRNFLIPQGMALLAKGKASKELRHRLQYIKKLRDGKILLAKEQSLKLKTLNLEVKRKAGAEGKLFGSVTNRDLCELLKENNFDFSRRSILLNTPIRSVGIHEFSVRVHTEVTETLKIKVIGDITKKSPAEELVDKNLDNITIQEQEESKEQKEKKVLKENREQGESKEQKEKKVMKENKEQKEKKELKENKEQ